MQPVNGVPVYESDPRLIYSGLNVEPTWFSAQGGVYKCYERSTNRPVAIKKYLVEENHPYDEDMFVMPKELVENEIYTMTKCVHPNILKLLAVHLHKEFVYLILPLCTGGSLQQYVFEHHLTVGQLVHIITSIASGLAKVHSQGYIHRDIKCDNIFLDEVTNSIVIGDFGVVSISPTADSSVEEAGVVLFWSPELVQQRIVNYKVDIWALGIVILEVLNGGKAPYEDENLEEEEIKQRILKIGRPVYPDHLPASLVDLLDHCLDVDPQTRYSAVNVLEHPFVQEFQPEKLFPATQLDHEVSSQSDSDPSDMMQDIIEEGTKHMLETSNQKEQQPLHIATEDLQQHCYNDISSTAAPVALPHSFHTPAISTAAQHVNNTKKPLSPTAAKCRLPVPSFSVDKSISSAIPVREKIANVIRKRQSMTDESRSQGCRIPMLTPKSLVGPLIEEVNTTEKVQQQWSPQNTVKSVAKSIKPLSNPRVNSPLTQQKTFNAVTPIPVSESLLRKPLVQKTNKMAPVSHVEQRQQKTVAASIKADKQRFLLKQQQLPSRSVLSEKTNLRQPRINANGTGIAAPKIRRDLTPRSSVYRKRLPTSGESRTARLMMGLSTGGRRQSYKQREEATAIIANDAVNSTNRNNIGTTNKLATPPLNHRYGRIFESKLKPPLITAPASTASAVNRTDRKRPVSFAASTSTFPNKAYSELHIQQQLKPIPSTTTAFDNNGNSISTLKANRYKRQSVPAPVSRSLDDIRSKAVVQSNHSRKVRAKANDSSSASKKDDNSSSNKQQQALRVH